MFETTDSANHTYKTKVAKIDTEKRISQVSVKIFNGHAIVGIRITDDEGKHMVNLNWSGVGNWQKTEIPTGQEIIGLECNTTEFEASIPKIGLKMWTPRITKDNEVQERKTW